MAFRDYTDHDALSLAAMIRRGDVTRAEVLDAAMGELERWNPAINAVLRSDPARAMQQSAGAAPDAPFAGVPYLLKDLMAHEAGQPMAAGCAALAANVATFDSELTLRLRRAGLAILGRTNTPEFGLVPTTEPRLSGPTRNPWNLAHSAGGSSGGAAAAVAARVVPAAHANDGGGSIRIPASCCGVFGLKPTRGRNPLGPAHGDVLAGMVVEHAVTVTVRDSAALLDATHGPDVGDPYVAPPVARPFLQEVGVPPGRLRVAVLRRPPVDVAVHAECVAAVDDAAALMAELGHEVDEHVLPVDSATLVEAFTVLWTASASAAVAGIARAAGVAPDDRMFEPLTLALHERGARYSAAECLGAIGRLQMIGRAVARFMRDWDVILSPTLAEPPPPLGTFTAPSSELERLFWRGFQYSPYTLLANATGQPAMSVPLHWSPAGLPVGIHFIGRFGDEATLFRLAAQLEEARPWRHRRPAPPAAAR